MGDLVLRNHLKDVLDAIDGAGHGFSAQAYGYLGEQIVPLLTTVIALYIACYGLQVALGTTSISASDLIGRLVRIAVIFALATRWDYFNTLFFGWLDRTPEVIGNALLKLLAGQDPLDGLFRVWKTANEAASAFNERGDGGLVDLIGLLTIAAAGLFVGIALAILILAKVMLWVLVGTGPIFIACMLFEPTRSYGRGWISQVVVYTITPLLVYVLAAFLLVGISTSLYRLEKYMAMTDMLRLPDLPMFILMCIAGAIVMAQVQIHAQRIARGVEGGIVSGVRRTTGWFSARAAAAGGQGWRQNPALLLDGTVDRGAIPVHAGGTDLVQAMQNRISANSMPR